MPPSLPLRSSARTAAPPFDGRTAAATTKPIPSPNRRLAMSGLWGLRLSTNGASTHTERTPICEGPQRYEHLKGTFTQEASAPLRPSRGHIPASRLGDAPLVAGAFSAGSCGMSGEVG